MRTLVVIACWLALTAALPLQQESSELSPEETYIDNDIPDDTEELEGYLTSLLSDDTELPMVYLPEKRSRYYRRYPWKRQNGRNYDLDSYLCTPTRQDVFHLLLALHDARSGNLDRQINFCNRRRPARAVFTNIRFLGRR